MAQEQGEGVPVFEQVTHGLAQARVGLHLFEFELLPHPEFEGVHYRSTVLLVKAQAFLGCEPAFLALGVVVVDLSLIFEDPAAFGREGIDNVHKASPSVVRMQCAAYCSCADTTNGSNLWPH